MRRAAPKSCVCATSQLAPTHVPALSALPGVLERSKVAFGSRQPGNLGLDWLEKRSNLLRAKTINPRQSRRLVLDEY
jgi:hypothetical protein